MKKNLFLLIVSFLFLGSIQAQNHYTPVDADQGSKSFNAWCKVFIDGVQQTASNTEIELGTFLDDVCKSSDRVASYYNGNLMACKVYFVYDAAGTVTFKCYNHNTEDELECDYTATTNAEGGTTLGEISLYFVSEVNPEIFEITVSANPTEGGTVTGGNTYEQGASCTVTATANEGYTFVNWTENNNEVSQDATYTFEVQSDRTLVANFEAEEPGEPDYPWDPVNPNQYPGNVTLIGKIQINGSSTPMGETYDLGAFCGNEYRTTEVYDDEDTLIIMSVMGTTGEQISFKLYDKVTGAYVGVCDYIMTYPSDIYGLVGDLDAPIILNFIVEQSFTKNIHGYGNGTNYFYLISSPIGTVDPEAVGGMFDFNFDLYYFDQNSELEWINYKNEDNTINHFNLEAGKGYLYASSENTTLVFTGTAYDGDGIVLLDMDASNNPTGIFEGWNLVGNPFADTAYIDRPFYTMNEDGSEIVTGEGNKVEPMEGIFVIATEDQETMTFSTEPIQEGGKLMLNLTGNRGTVIDRAVVSFSSSRNLPKFMLNEGHTKLYIQKDNKGYAVLPASEEEESMTVNFKASQNGFYTLNANASLVEMEYLNLVDHKTGATVDLLANPTYTFEANTADNTSRFTIQFKSNSNVNTNEMSNPINYRQNGQLTIIGVDGESELQVVDVLGRIINSTKVNGEYNQVLTEKAGVYTIRLITPDKTYTQKIVIE